MVEEPIEENFPLKAMLWPGAILGTIAHAVFMTRAPFLSHEQSWENRNYSIQNSQGSQATVSFGEDDKTFVAVFFVIDCARKLPSPADRLRFPILMNSIPPSLKSLWNEALQYVLQDVNGVPSPIITGAFWSDPEGSRIASFETWQETKECGAILLKNQLMPVELGIDSWAKNFQFNINEVSLVRDIFEKRMQHTSGLLELSSNEAARLKQLARDELAIKTCQDSFREIGINVT